MRLNDLVLGISIVAIGLAALLGAQTFPPAAGTVFGAAFFPSLVSWLLIVAGTALTIAAARRRAATGATAHRPLVLVASWWREPRRAVQAAAIPTACILYVWAAPRFGFAPTACVELVALFVLFGARLLPATALAIIFTAGFYLVFVVGFGVPLPIGPLGNLELPF